MIRRTLSYIVPCVLVAVCMLAWSLIPGEAQDDTDARISGLEARVSILETQVSSLAEPSSTVSTTGESDEPVSFTITGELLVGNRINPGDVVRDPAVYDPAKKTCANTRTMSGFHTGAKVTVLDGSGNTLAVTELETKPGFVPEGMDTGDCRYVFSVEVPDFQFIIISIDGIESETYSKQELEDNDWLLELSI